MEEIKESLLKNKKALEECILELEKFESQTEIPENLLLKINNTGIFIRNCAYHLGYSQNKY